MKPIHTIWAFAVVVALCVPALRAQDTQGAKQDSGSVNPDAPLPPIGETPEVRSGQPPAAAARGISSGEDLQPYNPAQVEPDTHTLSGAELFSVGSLGKSRTILDPSLYFSEIGSRGSLVGQTSFLSNTLVGGTLNIDHSWSNSRLVLSYNGGESITTPQYQQNTSFHDFSVEDAITWARMTFRIRDDLLFSPQAGFGEQGMGGPGMIGLFAGSLQSAILSNFVPGETIQTGVTSRLQDTALGELDYALSRRSTVTFSGSYGLLHFTGPGYIDSHSMNAQVGYDYALDPKNTIAVIGTYGRMDFVGLPLKTDYYSGQLAYGRKVTGRVAMRLAAGPEQIQLPITGFRKLQFLSWAANAGISYQRRRIGYSLNYSHGLTSGSGVLVGALSHTVSGSIQRNLTRYWAGSLNGGYAFNRNIVVPGVVTTSFSFTNWYAGANLSRRLNYHMNISFNYGLQHQTNSNICPVVSCGGTGFENTFGMTVNWHLRRVE